MVSSALARLLAALVIAAGIGVSASRTALQGDVSHPFLGVTYIDRTETTPRPIHMHVAQIDLTSAGLRFKLSPPGGSRETVRQTTLDYLKQEGAQLAINAHYFLPFPSPEPDADAIGLAASEGRVFSTFESPVQNYALIPDSPAINIDAANRATLVHRDPRAENRAAVLESVRLWNALSGSAQIVTSGVATVPDYLDANHPNGILKPGGPANYSNERSWYDAFNARTAIGLSEDGRTLTLFTVDVRGGSMGLSVREMADLLRRDYRVWHALNLDGGGSTSMALEDPVTRVARLVNTSSDNPGGRAVATSLAVFARRNSE